MSRLSFTILGVPVAQGSKRHVGKGVMVESSKHLLPWRQAVAAEAHAALNGRRPFEGPVSTNINFVFPRPKNHYRTGKHSAELRDNAPRFHSTRPDADKLARAILDGLVAGGVLHDDSQVASLHCRKVYADRFLPCADVCVDTLTSVTPTVTR